MNFYMHIGTIRYLFSIVILIDLAGGVVTKNMARFALKKTDTVLFGKIIDELVDLGVIKQKSKTKLKQTTTYIYLTEKSKALVDQIITINDAFGVCDIDHISTVLEGNAKTLKRISETFDISE